MDLPTANIVVTKDGALVTSTGDVLVIGTRSDCDLMVRDPVAAPRHCSISHDGAFAVKDLGTVTGTYVDGQPARPDAPIADGSEIVLGVTRLVAALGEADGLPQLTLDFQPNSFHFVRPRKKAFDNDPDRWVRTELGLGRFPALRRLDLGTALLAFLLLGALALGSRVTNRLVDAGPLTGWHARLLAGGVNDAERSLDSDFERHAQLAGAQGCEVCHTAGAGAVTSKCMQCHDDLAAPATRRHPYLVDGKLASTPNMKGDESFCRSCHVDHAAPEFLKAGARSVLGNCPACHGASVPQAPEIAVAKRTEGKVVATFTFRHQGHLERGIDCHVCHVPDPEVLAGVAARLDDPGRDDFADVSFETCASCHVDGAGPNPSIPQERREEWLARERRFDVKWHGSGGGASTCGRCHAATSGDGATVYGPELRTIERLELSPAEYAAARARYSLTRRQHAPEFEAHAAGKQCSECHARPELLSSERSVERTFWHALHLPPDAVTIVGPDDQRTISQQECLPCHVERGKSAGLVTANAGGFRWPGDDAARQACAGCHEQRKGEPLPPDAGRSGVWRTDQKRAKPDFPHSAHTNFAPGGKLAAGCFTCHEFVGPEGTVFEFVPRTKAMASDCTSCHARHASIGGGRCESCHPSPPEESNVYLLTSRVPPGTMVGGRRVPDPPRHIGWPERNAFSHFSRGHVEANKVCSTCHDVAGTRSAKGQRDVPIPDESAPACRKCHQERRFHWR